MSPPPLPSFLHHPWKRSHKGTLKIFNCSFQTDYGAGLRAQDPKTSEPFLLGIASLNLDCKSIRSNIYTRVSAILDWITEVGPWSITLKTGPLRHAPPIGSTAAIEGKRLDSCVPGCIPGHVSSFVYDRASNNNWMSVKIKEKCIFKNKN